MNNKFLNYKVSTKFAIICCFSCAIIVATLCFIFLQTDRTDELQALKKNYADNPTNTNLVLLCDYLETNDNIEILNYLEDAVNIDNLELESIVKNLYPTIEGVDMDDYKGIWISTSLALIANEGDVDLYEEVFLKFFPCMPYEHRMMSYASCFYKYKTNFAFENRETIRELILGLYEKSTNSNEKMEYLNILCAFYETTGFFGDTVTKEILSKRKLLLDTFSKDEVEKWEYLYTYDQLSWKLIKQSGDGSVIDNSANQGTVL